MEIKRLSALTTEVAALKGVAGECELLKKENGALKAEFAVVSAEVAAQKVCTSNRLRSRLQLTLWV